MECFLIGVFFDSSEHDGELVWTNINVLQIYYSFCFFGAPKMRVCHMVSNKYQYLMLVVSRWMKSSMGKMVEWG